MTTILVSDYYNNCHSKTDTFGVKNRKRELNQFKKLKEKYENKKS